MLFPGLQRQHKTAFSVLVHRHAGYSARHLPHQRFFAREYAEIRTAVRKRQTETLAFSYREVCTVFAGRLEYPETGRIRSRYKHRAGFPGRFRRCRSVFYYSEKVWRLQHEAGGVTVQYFPQIFSVGRSVPQRGRYERVFFRFGEISLQHFYILRVYRGGVHYLFPAGYPHCRAGSLGESGGSVVHGSV